MFEEFACGCIVSPVQGRVRYCESHRNVFENDTKVVSYPTGKVSRIYPGNGEAVRGWTGR